MTPALLRIADAPAPERARALVLISAWWTLAEMSSTGVRFVDLVTLAARDPAAADALGEELTHRLRAIVLRELGVNPGAVLTPEARAFVRSVVARMLEPAATNEAPCPPPR